jgi:hypothetical protein
MHNVVLSPIDTETLINRIALKTAELIESRKNEKPERYTTEQMDLLSPKETAKLLKISTVTLWRWEKKGKVKCYGKGGKRYYKRNELIESLTVKK